jgi:hypothetical protein
METDGHAILLVTSAVIKKGQSELEAQVEHDLEEVRTAPEAENQDNDNVEVLEQGEHDGVLVDEIGARISEDITEEDAPNPSQPGRRRFRTKEEHNTREAHYLSMYMSGKICRRKVWGDFFGNSRKR